MLFSIKCQPITNEKLPTVDIVGAIEGGDEASCILQSIVIHAFAVNDRNLKSLQKLDAGC